MSEGTMIAADLILRRATLADGTEADVALRDGRVARIAPHLEETGRREEDLRGRLLLPSFVDLHMHLDKAFTLEETCNESGTLREAIDRYERLTPHLKRDGYVERALRTLRLCLAAGTTAVRTHVNVCTGKDGLMPFEVLLEVRECVRDAIDLQIVLLPSGNPAHDRALYDACEEALRLGADAMGGAPHLDVDSCAMIETVFALATRFGRDVDLHVDESDDPNACTLMTVAETTMRAGYEGRVVAGHCCSLAAMDDAAAGRIVEQVAAAGMTVVALPSCNLYLQGRGDRWPVRRGLTRVKDLAAAGVNVAAASDNVRDPFNPFGRGDLLHIADLLAHAAHLGSPAEQRLVRDAIAANPRAAFTHGDPAYLRGGAIREGDPADLVVCDVSCPTDLIAAQPARTLVLHTGRIVARTQVVQDVSIPVARSAATS